MRGGRAGSALLAAAIALSALAPAIALSALAPAAAATAAQGPAPTVATSPRPDRVAVTVYRAPNQSPGRELDLEWLDGYALISETRTISIPAGETELRFEGVAGGIVPQSAIVTGLPDGVIEKNHDAYLLSPASLLDRSLGRRVHLRRTSRETGRVVEQEAVIRSGAGGAVVLETPEGFETLRCTGLAETLNYSEVPAGLASRPTLSVRARSSRPVSATVTLSYLATGFDWQANYVLNLSADGQQVDLFAWLTLASGDETSFVDAQTQAVAGRLNREEDEDDDDYDDEDAEEAAQLRLNCWPSGRTSDVPPAVVQDEDFRLSGRVNVGQVINGLPAVYADEGQDIMVTGSRIVRQEELGDVKLYRLPERVTVASNSQKQVALLQQPNVRVRTLYRARVYANDEDGRIEATRMLVTRNRTQEGLGMPLPAGRVVMFGEGHARPILLGEGSLRDRAVGEDVEIELDEAPGIVARVEEPEDADYKEDVTHYVLTVSNDRPYPIQYEAELTVDSNERLRSRTRLGRRNGKALWSVTVPANGEASLRYRVREIEVEEEDDDEDDGDEED
ncbi:MAG TPA: hypothetical protein VEZ20_00980 [Allosphingosinicella sp.]|nr:hypothetical protein [Allosphingosinicella sp.]